MLAESEGLDRSDRDATAWERHRPVTGHIRENVDRMDHPECLRSGWQTGPGSMGSACKGVVCQRLRGTGMRRGGDGADAVCDRRALLRSGPGQWEAFWNRRVNKSEGPHLRN